MENANPHHFVFGELEDFLTGRTLPDTHDERYRQKIARLLVTEKKFEKRHIKSNQLLEVAAGGRRATLKLDFLIRLKGKAVMLIRYAPGSLVTRRLTSLALSRIVEPYQIPFTVITNGEDAEIIDGHSGRVVAQGLGNLPEKAALEKADFSFEAIRQPVFDQASRIVYACEVDGACPCDTDVCILE